MDIERVIQNILQALRVHKYTACGEKHTFGYVSQETMEKIQEKEIILEALQEKQKRDRRRYRNLDLKNLSLMQRDSRSDI